MNFKQIIFIFFTYFFDPKKIIDKRFKIELLKTIFNSINNKNEVVLTSDLFLSLFKQCILLNFKPGNINSIRIFDSEKEKKNKINQELYLTNEEIERLNLGEQKERFQNLMVSIYINHDKKQLMKLIQSSNGKDYCRKVLDLVYKKELQLNDFHLIKQTNINTLQKNLLEVSEKKEEIQFILSLSKGLLDYLNFINNNYY